MVISQKRLNFGMKRNYKVQGKMGCNGLGNRCSTKRPRTNIFEVSRQRICQEPTWTVIHARQFLATR
jgi:hypothetical protein